MKNNIIGLLLFAVAIVVSISGCRSVRPPVTTNQIVERTNTVTIVQRDTVFITQPDSSFYKAWIECVNGKPVIKSGSEKASPGKYLEKPGVKLNGNELLVDCKAKAQELFAQWQEQYVKEHEKETITLPPVEVEKQLSWWQVTQIWAGRIALGLLAILLGFALFKKYLKPI